MGQQFEQMLRDLSRSVDATAKTVEIYLKRVEELGREHGDMRDRLVALETGSKFDVKHGEREHDQLRARLTEGDNEFRALRVQAQAAVARAESAVRQIGDLQRQLREETKRQKPGLDWKKVGGNVAAAVLTSAALWLIQHFYYLAKLAELADKVKGGHP